MSAAALDDARARVAGAGGTIGEQLVTSGALSDDELTEFYRARLLVPQVNANTLARLAPKVVGTIPGDMAIELRAIPVSLDRDNNLTVAMSDPSDRHAVDEIAFFTGAYVVRAVATQMQIAWCLAHYYGHVTPLGQRLLHASEGSPIKAALAQIEAQPPRTKGLTGKVDAARHRAIAPITGPVNVQRPNSGELDLRPLVKAARPADRQLADRQSADRQSADRQSADRQSDRAGELTHTPVDATPATPIDISVRQPLVMLPPRPAGTPVQPMIATVVDDARVPMRRAASIRPPMPEPDDSDEPDIVIEPPPPRPEPDPGAAPADDDMTGVRKRPVLRRRAAKTDPPELRARAGEVDDKVGTDRRLDADEPRIVIDEDALAPPKKTVIGVPAAPRLSLGPDGDGAPSDAMDEDDDTGAVIHDRIAERSEPVLLDRRRMALVLRPLHNGLGTQPLPRPDLSDAGTDDDVGEVGDDVGDDDDLAPPPPPARPGSQPTPTPRPERRTQVGMAPAPALSRAHRDTEATGIPAMMLDDPSDRTVEGPIVVEDRTKLDVRAVSAAGDETRADLAAPPRPSHPDDTNPHLLAAPPAPAPPRSSLLQAAVIVDDHDDDHDDDDDELEDRDERDTGENAALDRAELEIATGEHPRRTKVMSSLELDEVMPDRPADRPAPKAAPPPPRRIDYDPLDDGWGPPGTTIPPPLLGAIPGSEDDDAPSVIPMASVDSSPLLIGPLSLSPAGDASGLTLARALDSATSRALEVIRQLETAQSRDEVVAIMIAHLTETHHRAGFFMTRPSADKVGTELGLFTMTPRPAVMSFATLRLDRPSTLADVVGTRLPYRGPMHDDASRSFLISLLGACPAEILLVPVAVRERVVGVLFGEHRLRHTFDDQVAMAARAAGMALERILKTKRP